MSKRRSSVIGNFHPESDAERILADLLDTGMISLGDVQTAEIMKRKPQVLSVHPYSITHCKSQTYLLSPTFPNRSCCWKSKIGFFTFERIDI